jgi:hypothetical protein
VDCLALGGAAEAWLRRSLVTLTLRLPASFFAGGGEGGGGDLRAAFVLSGGGLPGGVGGLGGLLRKLDSD